MDEESNGNPPAELSAEEKATLEETEVTFSDDEKDIWEEETQNKVNSMFAQKKHFRDKFEKTNKDFEEYKVNHPDVLPEKEEKKPLKKDDDTAFLRAELQEIRLQQNNPTLNSDNVKKAIAYAKAEGVEPQDFIKTDFFQAYIEKQAEKEANSNSSPNPSNRSGNSTSQFTGKETKDQIEAMSEDTFEKYSKWREKQEGGKLGELRVGSSIGV